MHLPRSGRADVLSSGAVSPLPERGVRGDGRIALNPLGFGCRRAGHRLLSLDE